MILELRFMTIPFYVQRTTNDLYKLHRGAIDFQQVRGTIKNVDVYNNKLLNTLADSMITKL